MEDSNLYTKEVVQFGKGLYTDSSPQVQPEGTLRFALNCVDETEKGDILFPSNMESNIDDGVLPSGYIPIGKVYIGEGETALFLTSLSGGSEIGIYSDRTGYATYLNNPTLNFKITHQIDAVYRLRRGCDRTIYWTDNLNPIRQYVFNREEDYYINGVFNEESLHLFKRWDKIPKFEKFTIEESGTLKAGSYNFAIQYLDSDLNPTEWMITSDTINIYHDNLTQPFRDIEGSTNVKNEYQNWGDSTGKSIRLELSNLDTDFNFYRVGIIEATSGTGLVSRVIASSPISTKVANYTFTGNAESIITVEEIMQSSTVIDTAQSIEQIENKLILGNTKGKQIDFCRLQQYASKIVSNYIKEEVVLDQIDKFITTENSGPQEEAASKDPLINIKKVGYMPGEIYSFGIVYYFKDGSYTPVYHIPGKNPSYGNTSNMADNNIIEDRYTDSSNCNSSDYWGRDYKGVPLKNTPIRHHRFPTRAEANMGFIEEKLISKNSASGYKLSATVVVPPLTSTTTITKYKTQATKPSTPTGDALDWDNVATPETENVYEEVGTNLYDRQFLINQGWQQVQSDSIGKTNSGTHISDYLIDSSKFEPNKKYKFSDLRTYGWGSSIVTNYSDGTNSIATLASGANTYFDTDSNKTVLNIKVEIPVYSEYVRKAEIFDTARFYKLSLVSSVDNTIWISQKIITNGVASGWSDPIVWNGVVPDNSDSSSNSNYKIDFTGVFGNSSIDKTLYIPGSIAQETYNIELTQMQGSEEPTTNGVVHTTNLPLGYTISYSVAPVVVSDSRYGYTAKIMGIKFSNILNINTLEGLTGNNEIIGYKIVRNERKEIDKTILDSGILFPISEYENFLGYGHSIPNILDANFGVRNDIYAFINPEFLFNKREYTQSNVEFIRAGEFKRLPTKIQLGTPGRLAVQGDRIIENYIEDAYPGTTLDPEVHKGKDPDGLDLHTISRYRDTEYKYGDKIGESFFSRGEKSNIRKVFYLDALGSISTSIGDKNKDIFNISSDNRIGIIQLEENIELPFKKTSSFTVRVPKFKEVTLNGIKENLFTDQRIIEDKTFKPDANTDYYQVPIQTYENTPYFYMKRNIANPYENFRYSTYYAEHDNVIPIEQENVKIFNGDVYISPMTYNNSFYHDIKAQKRKTKKTWWKYVAGALLIVAGVIGGILTGGAAGVLAGVGVGLLGAAAGVSTISSGITMDRVNAIYNDEYEKGLKQVSRDGTTKSIFVDGKTFKQLDDEIQWYNDVINGIWFESQVNIGVRQGTTLGIPAFIPSPFEFMPPDSTFINALGGVTIDYSNDYFRRRAIEKISVLEPEFDGGRLYLGYAIAEYYEINKDLQRRNREKPYFHLGLEYDCCSDCFETFPHRIHYSEQSFQEELTDNFRVFLPNNYIDIDGETGEVTNIFKIQNELFIHTEEAIWKLPKNYQERVTDEIVSFIGTGSYFSVPPQKLVDDETGSSYGTRHKWSRLKTPVGYFFVSEGQNAICLFDGNEIKNIAKLGTYYWLYDNIPIQSDTVHRDNPSNPEGVGFICVYDSKKDLVFITKKDRFPSGEDNSWTLSYNLKKNSWGSWHSFMPNFYIQTPKNYFSWIYNNKNIWKHNVLGNYQTYYNKLYPYIMEYVLTDNPLQNKTFEDITVFSESKKYDPISKTFYDIQDSFFNKLLAYNNRQCTGILNITIKDKEDIDFFMNQVSNSNLQNITADRNERNWTINELRDMVTTKDKSIFITDVKQLQDDYFIDKKLNNDVIDYNKDWTQIESFRDKYLVVRFIFDTFADIKLITNFTANTEKISMR